MGAAASTYTTNGNEMDIVVRAKIDSLDELMEMPVVGSISDTKVLLGQIGKVTLEPAVPLIKHYNGKRYVNVLADVLPGYVSGSIQTELTEEYMPVLDTEGIELIEQGEMKNMMSLIGSLGRAAIVAILLIYIILLLQFKNFAKPFNVLTSIPLSLI